MAGCLVLLSIGFEKTKVPHFISPEFPFIVLIEARFGDITLIIL